MSSLIVPVTTIEAIKPHSNADSLELAQVLGWQLIVRKGEYQPGERIVYFPIDTLLPLEVSERFGVTKYLSKQRIRCTKLRGQPSFGLAVRPDEDWPLGENVAEYYGATKYEPPIRVTAGDAERDHHLFVTYTDMENARHFPTVFEQGEPVMLSEKIHGCLCYKTKVTMADGSKKRIMDIEEGEYVLGVDSEGKVIPSLVLQRFNNGKAEKWLTVTGKRKKAGKGNNTWNVHCTPNHKFWNPEKKEYVSAENLIPGDKTFLIRNQLDLTPIQEQILIGKMLGDGSLQKTTYGAASITWRHKKEHEKYIDWTNQGLGEIAYNSKRNAFSGYGSEMIVSNTIFHPSIFSLFEDWMDENGKKKVPESISDKLSPISMAFWYMDDGSLSHHPDQEDRALFATCAFTENDCRVLQKGFSKFGIKAEYSSSFNNEKSSAIHSRLRLNSEEAEKFFLLIAPYVPPCMQYKLPERYRGHFGWLPSSTNVYKPVLIEQEIEEVFVNETIESAKWDLETETHNFFANSILVHNSNARVGCIEGELMAGSKGLRRKRPEDDESFGKNTYWFPLSLGSVRTMLETLGSEHRQVILFGEVYGSKIQSLHYGLHRTLGFRAFDLLLDGSYVDWPHFLELCTLYGVETVPVLATIPYDLAEVKRYSEGKTQLMAKSDGPHIREGVVVRPMVERHDPQVGRVILKYVSDTYLFGENSDYTDV